MILWTFQHEKAYEQLLQQGFLHANDEYLFCRDDFRFAYDWLAERMKEQIGQSPESVRYPIWAWYKLNGERKKPDLRLAEFKFREPQVLLEIDVPEDQVLLSDEETWHFVLNNWYYPKAETMADWSKEDDWFDSLPDGDEKEAIRRSSWENIFNIQYETNETGTHGRYIQATLWELRSEQIMKARKIPAKIK